MIGIFLTATNQYSILGLRFLHKFERYYRAAKDKPCTFYIYSDVDPRSYIPNLNIVWTNTVHHDWLSAVNSRFQTVIDMDIKTEYIYHFDADTNITRPFTLDMMIGNIVGGEHFGNTTWMAEKKNYDRNPNSLAYIPENTPLPQMYYLGAFWGGRVNNVKNMCKTLVEWQRQDKLINYEPAVNDESYLNKYFHYNKPTTVLYKDFPFQISCKGGLSDTRQPNKDKINRLLSNIPNRNWDIKLGEIVYE